MGMQEKKNIYTVLYLLSVLLYATAIIVQPINLWSTYCIRE